MQVYFSCNKINAAIKRNERFILLQHLFHFIAHETAALIYLFLSLYLCFDLFSNCVFLVKLLNAIHTACILIVQLRFLDPKLQCGGYDKTQIPLHSSCRKPALNLLKTCFDQVSASLEQVANKSLTK